MASVDKDLEDRLMEAGSRLAALPSTTEELLALLDQTENLLSRVDQSPSQSMSSALRPAVKALVGKDLLEHSDMDVKVAVASCVSEITRITAPDAPYDDDMMKVVFQIIVEAFEKLDDVSSRSYSKRVSILETVAKVRSCVVMLDLECDALILEMFRYFLKTIRSNHPENIFSSMETIMTLVLEESEDISSELLLCLLDSVKKDEEIPPIVFKLGERVIGNCAGKLKPYLMQVQFSRALGDYSKIIASICQENSDALEQNEINISGEILVDDSKLSERTVSDELPQGSVKMDHEVGSPEKVATADKPPKSGMSNGIVQRGNGNNVVEPTSPKQKPERSRRSGQSKNNGSADIADSDNLESVEVKSDSTLDLKTKKTRVRKANSLNQVADTTETYRSDSDKETPSVPNMRTGHSKEANSSQFDGPSGKEAKLAISQEPEDKNDPQPPHKSDNGSLCISSPTPSESVLDATRSKRGRPLGSKSSGKKGVNAVVEQRASTSGDKGTLGRGQTQDELMPSVDNDLKKELESISNSEGKSHRRRGKKVHSDNAVDVETTATLTNVSEAKPLRKPGKNESKKKFNKGESSEKKKSNIKQPKEKISLEKDAAGESNLKDASTKSDTNLQSKDQSYLEDSSKTNSRRKRVRSTEKISGTLDQNIKLDQSIVGSRIKIWWPDDKKFYDGRIDSFSPDTGKHQVVYDDGDVELLLLKEERYSLVEGANETEVGQASDVPSPIATPEVSRHKRAKVNSDSMSKQAKTDSPLKGGTDSGKHSISMKAKGRPRGGSSRKSEETAASKSKDDSLKGRRKIKGPGNKSKTDMPDTGSKDDTPTTSGRKRKEAPPKSERMSKDGISKTSSKVKDNTPKKGRKLMDETMEDTPKTASKSKDKSSDIGKHGVRRSKSNQVTPKVGRKSIRKDDGTPKSGNDFIAESETPSKAQESETPSKAQETRISTGKRKRKGHK